MKNIRNIGIFAHVDAGKTTLSEQILVRCGAVRTRGSVDSGTAHTDTLPVEKRRGISVKSTCVSFTHRGVTVNLIDTPGHVDFSAEVERSLWALDAAILVVCAVEGVQPQTEVLFSAMQEQNIPVTFFVNKTDRDGADALRVISDIRRLLSDKAVDAADDTAVCEAMCDYDDELLEKYLNGEEIPQELIYEKLCRYASEGLIYPVLCGSALRDMGIEPLMDGIADFFPAPRETDGLCGIAFAAEQDAALGRGVWVRLYGGELVNRDTVTVSLGENPVTGEAKTEQRKIFQIKNASGQPVGRLSAGEIGLIYGLSDVEIGHVFGNKSLLPRSFALGRLRTPLITVQAIPDKAEDMTSLRRACDVLSGEDPLLHAQYIRSLNQLQLSVMGTIQLEILEEVLKTRFHLGVTFSRPAVIYRETITEKSEGFVAYVMPKPCWAVLKFLIEPAPRGSGVTYKSVVALRDIKLRYQHQVEQAIPLALAQGRLGWQVDDVNITLIDGGDHDIHTHPLDFIVATPMAIQDGLMRGGSTLLEPILDARFRLPRECVGRVMSDVISMRGEIVDNETDGDRTKLTALIPVSESLDYAVTLASLSGGRGTMSVKLHGYRECPLELGATAERRNVDPLDKSKYILAARNALEGGIFDI